MEKLNLGKKYETVQIVDDEGNELGLIKFDIADPGVVERFNQLVESMEGIDAKLEERYKQIDAEFADETENREYRVVVAKSTARVDAIREMVAGVDGIFGKDTMRKVLRECYEQNEDYCPDEGTILDFLSGMIPLMQKHYGNRIREISKKYSVKRRGKHTKSKDELIAEYHHD